MRPRSARTKTQVNQYLLYSSVAPELDPLAVLELEFLSTKYLSLLIQEMPPPAPLSDRSNRNVKSTEVKPVKKMSSITANKVKEREEKEALRNRKGNLINPFE